MPHASVIRDSEEVVNIQEFVKKVLKRQGSVSNHAIGVSGKPDNLLNGIKMKEYKTNLLKTFGIVLCD